MSARNSLIASIIITLILIVTFSISQAFQHADPRNTPPPKRDAITKLPTQPYRNIRKPKSSAADIKPLGTTVKLVFTIKEAEESPKFTIVSATQGYEISVNHSEGTHSHELLIKGQLRPANDKLSAVLLTYDFLRAHEGDNETAQFAAKGSAIVNFKNESILMQNEAFTLTVKAEQLK